MAVFILDTDSVSAAKGTMDSIGSQVDSLASSVSGYDTSCEDFDFSSPKSVIASNIEAFGIKVKNTGALMDSVVSSHTSLQNSLKFTSSAEKEAQKAKDEEQKKNQNKNNNNNNNNNSNNNNRNNNNNNNNYTPSPTPTPTPTPSTEPETNPPATEITEKIEKVDHVKVDKDKLTDEMKKIFDAVKYDEAGYALYGTMYVIACSAAVGKVGEIVEFTMSDGKTMRCIVGQNLEGTGEIHFFINGDWKENGEKNPTKDFVSKLSKIQNMGANDGTPIDPSTLPSIGEHTSKWSKLNDEWTVVTTKVSVPDYEKVVASKHISQNSDTSKYSDYCLAFSYVHASNMYNGNTSDTAEAAGNYRHAGEFTSFYSDSKTETLQKIYSEIVNGRPVVMQVNGNKTGTSRHFVTVVGFRNSVTDPNALTEKDLLIMDSWDGQIERMDQANSRFMTTGKQTGKDYTGYYLRTLKA